MINLDEYINILIERRRNEQIIKLKIWENLKKKKGSANISDCIPKRIPIREEPDAGQA